MADALLSDTAFVAGIRRTNLVTRHTCEMSATWDCGKDWMCLWMSWKVSDFPAILIFITLSN